MIAPVSCSFGRKYSSYKMLLMRERKDRERKERERKRTRMRRTRKMKERRGGA